MSKRKGLAIGLAALMLGLTIGGVGTATAATTTASTNPIVAGACGLGLSMGATIRESGARLIDIVAKLTGQSVEDVAAARAQGTSLEKIASEKGVSSDKVVDSALDARKELLDDKVKSGAITQAQADAALSTMESRLTERVSSTTPGRGGMGAGRGGGMGRGRGGAAGCGGACTPVSPAQ